MTRSSITNKRTRLLLSPTHQHQKQAIQRALLWFAVLLAVCGAGLLIIFHFFFH